MLGESVLRVITEETAERFVDIGLEVLMAAKLLVLV
jgi:hypothetical protein